MKITDPKFQSEVLKIAAIGTFALGIGGLFASNATFSSIELLAFVLRKTAMSDYTEDLLATVKNLSEIQPWLSGYFIFISIVMWLCSLKSKSPEK
ncbi:MAG TPA: hypothetical protein VIK35_08270 [Verrucomicrobiae bacterium]